MFPLNSAFTHVGAYSRETTFPFLSLCVHLNILMRDARLNYHKWNILMLMMCAGVFPSFSLRVWGIFQSFLRIRMKNRGEQVCYFNSGKLAQHSQRFLWIQMNQFFLTLVLLHTPLCPIMRHMGCLEKCASVVSNLLTIQLFRSVYLVRNF